MSDLPPPQLPPTGVGAPTPESAGAASNGNADWDWARVKVLAEAWFRPIADPAGWWALGYLFLSMLAAPFLFGAMVAVASIAFGLSFIVVGLLLVVPFFLMVEQFAVVEQRFAGLAGHRIEMRPAQVVDGVGPRNLKRAITDPVRWRHVGFIAANVVLAPMLFGFGAIPLSIVLQGVFGDGVINGPGFSFGTGLDIGFGNVFAVALAALFVGAIPRVAIWVAGLKAELDGWFLGTDKLAIAERRVIGALGSAPGHPRCRGQRAAPDRAQPARWCAAATRGDRSRPRHGGYPHRARSRSSQGTDRERPPEGAGFDRGASTARARSAPGDPGGPWHRRRPVGRGERVADPDLGPRRPRSRFVDRRRRDGLFRRQRGDRQRAQARRGTVWPRFTSPCRRRCQDRRSTTTGWAVSIHREVPGWPASVPESMPSTARSRSPRRSAARRHCLRRSPIEAERVVPASIRTRRSVRSSLTTRCCCATASCGC